MRHSRIDIQELGPRFRPSGLVISVTGEAKEDCQANQYPKRLGTWKARQMRTKIRVFYQNLEMQRGVIDKRKPVNQTKRKSTRI
ncbi:hypothetical protein VTJ04DRAFT_4920 [Mycothermus thermophilus]|uniref:uncharacterized protein n=1 Tax=Humicola insolens TaxID=85995 RepID=UPI0037449956